MITRYVESLGNNNTTSASYLTKVTDTFNVTVAGMYLFVAYAEISSTVITGILDGVVFQIDGLTVGSIDGTPMVANEQMPFFMIKGVTLAAGAHTVRIAYKSNGVATATIRNARILTLSDIFGLSYIESEGESSISVDAEAEKIALASIPAVLQRTIVLASWELRYTGNGSSSVDESWIALNGVIQGAHYGARLFGQKYMSLGYAWTEEHPVGEPARWSISYAARGNPTAATLIRRARIAVIPCAANLIVDIMPRAELGDPAFQTTSTSVVTYMASAISAPVAGNVMFFTSGRSRVDGAAHTMRQQLDGGSLLTDVQRTHLDLDWGRAAGFCFFGVAPSLAAGPHTMAFNGRSVSGAQVSLSAMRTLAFRVQDASYVQTPTVERWRPASLITIRVA